jgi:hypothetical protein
MLNGWWLDNPPPGSSPGQALCSSPAMRRDAGEDEAGGLSDLNVLNPFVWLIR